mgnify:CR=1 FL=1
MKWRGRRSSSNVNRRGSAGGGFGGGSRRSGGGFPMMPVGGGGGLILMIILFLVFGGNLFGGGGNSAPTNNTTQQEQGYDATAEEQELEDFLSVVLADTEDYWNQIFSERNMDYREPTLHIYQDTVRSGCGVAQSNMGPFYCPADEGIYIDVSFYHDLKNEYGAEGDFALAYVLAHEVGHHVQKQMGILDEVYSLQSQLPEAEFNQYMVRMELQADYLAGVFAHYTQENGYLEQGDFEEAMNAAAGVGDDRIQEKAWGQVVPDKFTHGTSEQRMRWFNRGFEYGDLENGDTFGVNQL